MTYFVVVLFVVAGLVANKFHEKDAIVFQINNFRLKLVKSYSDRKILTHFFHDAKNFTGILQISFEGFYD